MEIMSYELKSSQIPIMSEFSLSFIYHLKDFDRFPLHSTLYKIKTVIANW